MDASEKRIGKLHPKVRGEALAIYHECLQRLTGKVKPIVVQGLRTFAEQKALYDQGRVKPGPIVTKAKPGLSYHQYGLAVDYALVIDGKTISWDFKKDWDADQKADFMEIVEVHKAHGWMWGGDFHSIIDQPHFEQSFGHSVKDLLSLYNNGKTFVQDGQKYVAI